MPQSGRSFLSFPVNTTAFGFLDISCFETSQEMGLMFVQFAPCGQQSAEEELSRDMQDLLEGHLKLDGSCGSML